MILSPPWTSGMVHLSQMQTSRPGCGVTPPATATQRLVPSQLSSLFLGVFGSKFSPYSTFQLCCPPYLSPPLAAAPHSEPQLVLHTPNRVHPALQAWQKLTAPPPPGSLSWLNPLEGTSAPVTSVCLSQLSSSVTAATAWRFLMCPALSYCFSGIIIVLLEKPHEIKWSAKGHAAISNKSKQNTFVFYLSPFGLRAPYHSKAVGFISATPVPSRQPDT